MVRAARKRWNDSPVLPRLKDLGRRRVLAGGAGAVAFSLALSLTAGAAEAAAPNAPKFNRLVASVVARMQAKLPANAALVVLDPATGAVLHSRNGNAPMLPASTMKLVTATVALTSYPETQRFQTRVSFDPATNRLYLIGGGDPMLLREELAQLAADVAPQLPAATNFEVYTDISLFPAPTAAEGWVPNYVPGQVMPVSPLAIFGIRSKFPAARAASEFISKLQELGVTASYAGNAPMAGNEIASRSGRTLQAIVKHMLVFSDNNIAERLFRMSTVAAGLQPTWENSVAHATEVLTQLGIGTASLHLSDGSGLSRTNRLTAATLAQLLSIARNPANPKLQLLLDAHLLPIAGFNGTLRKRFAQKSTTCARGQVEAKTGTLFDVVSLAGYASTPDGLADFAIIVNGIDRARTVLTRKHVDWVVTALVGCRG